MPKLKLPGGAMLRHDGEIVPGVIRKIAVRRSDLRLALAGKVASGMTLITALHDLAPLCGFCGKGMSWQMAGQPCACPWKICAYVTSFEKRMIATLRSND